VALTEVTALRIDRGDFWELLAEKRSLALGVFTMLTQRLDEAVRDLARLSAFASRDHRSGRHRRPAAHARAMRQFER